MIKETGTLKELNVKVGDKVTFKTSEWGPYTVKKVGGVLKAVPDSRDDSWGTYVETSYSPDWKIISRASDHEYKTWGEMTDAEKGELLLAHHNGKTIQVANNSFDFFNTTPNWFDSQCYRIKPEPEVYPTVVSAWADRVDGEIDWSTLRKDK